MEDKFKIFTNTLEKALNDSGVTLGNARQELDTFYKRIEPPFQEALATGDDLSLKLFRDRSALLLGRVSYRTLHRHQQIAMATMMAALRVLVLL